MAATVSEKSRAKSKLARPAGDDIAVANPATGEIVGHVPDQGADEVAAVVARARAAQPAWEALGFDERGKVLRRAQKWMVDHADRVIATIVSETGKTYEDAQLAEVMYVADAFGFWAKHAEGYLSDEKVKAHSPLMLGKKLIVARRPVGVVGVIGPWNFPLTNSFGDCIPALAAGNAVVLKPSEVTPLTSQVALECLRECGLPDDVFAVVTGRAQTGEALIDEVDFVMFTGSTATGTKVMARAAQTLTGVSLELGGKDPMIVLADADLDRAANAAAFYSMNNGGQVCISIERAYVEASVHDAFVEKLVANVAAMRQGVPGGPGSVDIGAMTHPPQVDIVDRHVRDATDKGAVARTGGRPGTVEGGRGGQYYEPTVLTGADHTMLAMTEETFGPTLPVMRVADVDEAVRLANDSPYGLAASVWTKDTAKGEKVARRIDAGAVSVNDAQLHYTALELPMGGHKTSGIGSRHGADGIRKYTVAQSILVNRFAPKKDPYWFPYSARTTKVFGGVLRVLFGRGKRP